MPHASRHALLLLAVSMYCLLVLPRMLSYGMFLDGITYASIARNMAQNYGSFWRPYYTATVAPIFYDQPPLGFWLLSWAYRLFGEAVAIEAFWGFGAGALILVGLSQVWRGNSPQDDPLAGAWFPLLLFVIIPMTPWILSNNMLENTTTVFTMAAVYACLLSLTSAKKSWSVFYGLCAGCNIFLAFLVKGPVALFTITVPFLEKIRREEKFSKIILTFFYMIFTLLSLIVILLTVTNESSHFFSQYFNRQVIASLYGERGIATSRFNALYAICHDIIVSLIFVLLLTIFLYNKKIIRLSINYRLLAYYLCIALIGSLPLLISPKQRRWYVFPSLPFYALVIATAFNHTALALEKLINQNKKMSQYILIFSLIIFISSIILMFLGRNYIGRDKDFHNDFSLQPLHIEARETISVYPESLEHTWPLVANMQRQFTASLSKHFGHRYLLSTLEYKHAEQIPATYKLVHPAHPQKYLLFKVQD